MPGVHQSFCDLLEFVYFVVNGKHWCIVNDKFQENCCKHVPDYFAHKLISSFSENFFY